MKWTRNKKTKEISTLVEGLRILVQPEGTRTMVYVNDKLTYNLPNEQSAKEMIERSFKGR